MKKFIQEYGLIVVAILVGLVSILTITYFSPNIEIQSNNIIQTTTDDHSNKDFYVSRYHKGDRFTLGEYEYLILTNSNQNDEALVMMITNKGTAKFDNSSQNYDGSIIQVQMEQYYDNSLEELGLPQDAIIESDITVNSYLWRNGSTDEECYVQGTRGVSESWAYNLVLKNSEIIEGQHVYPLDVSDVVTYLGELTAAGVSEMFETTFGASGDDNCIWLRSKVTDNDYLTYDIDGYDAFIGTRGYDSSSSLHPAFICNLGKVESLSPDEPKEEPEEKTNLNQFVTQGSIITINGFEYLVLEDSGDSAYVMLRQVKEVVPFDTEKGYETKYDGSNLQAVMENYYNNSLKELGVPKKAILEQGFYPSVYFWNNYNSIEDFSYEYLDYSIENQHVYPISIFDMFSYTEWRYYNAGIEWNDNVTFNKLPPELFDFTDAEYWTRDINADYAYCQGAFVAFSSDLAKGVDYRYYDDEAAVVPTFWLDLNEVNIDSIASIVEFEGNEYRVLKCEDNELTLMSLDNATEGVPFGNTNAFTGSTLSSELNDCYYDYVENDWLVYKDCIINGYAYNAAVNTSNHASCADLSTKQDAGKASGYIRTISIDDVEEYFGGSYTNEDIWLFFWQSLSRPTDTTGTMTLTPQNSTNNIFIFDYWSGFASVDSATYDTYAAKAVFTVDLKKYQHKEHEIVIPT